MKRLKQLLLTATAALAAQLAHALPYTAGDVQLVFRASGYNDVEFNLGSVANFQNLPAGTPVTVTYDTNAVYTNFGNTFTGVKFAVVAATSSSVAQPTVWLSDANLAGTPTDFTLSKFSSVRGKIDQVGVQNGASTGTNNVPFIVAPTLGASYSAIVSPGNTTAIGTFGGDVPFTVEAVNPNSLAFFQVVASAANPKPNAIKLGQFDFATDGTITYTPVAVSPVFTSSSLSLQGGTQVAGNAKTFSFTADGACAYQWYLNGSPISGATGTTYTVSSPTLADAGAYTVVASNCTYGTTTTSPLAQMNVVALPTINTQPANQSVNRGASATFTVSATSTYAGTGIAPALAYQWYKDAVAISGATNSSYTIAATTLADIATYSVAVANTAGTVTSSNATLRFAGSTAYLAGDLQLVFRESGFNDLEFNLGSVSNFLNVASGSTIPVNFSLASVSNNFGNTLAGVKFALVAATTSTDSKPRIWLSDVNVTSPVPTYVTLSKFSALRGKVDNAGVQAASITLGAYPLSIASSSAASYSAIVSPGNSTAIGTFGGDAPFTVEAVNPNTLALYQLAASATTPKPAAVKVGTFNFAADGSITFTAAAVSPVLTSAALSAQAGTINAGSSKTFSVTADEACSYQWYKDGVAIGGATSSSYAVTSPALTDAGSYTVVASNCIYGTTTTSSAAQLNVIATPSITTQPANQTVNRGASATFSVATDAGYAGTGSAPTITYQWYKDGVAISGATASSYTINPTTLADIATYSVVVGNTAGSMTSSNATLRFAGSTSYLAGDLQLVFRQTGFNDLEFNLGTVSNFFGLASGTTVPVSFNLAAVSNNFGGSLSGVRFALVAATTSTDSKPRVWLSDANLSATPTDVTLSKFSVLRGKVDNAGVQAAAIAQGAYPAAIAPTAAGSYSAIVSPGNSTAIGTFGGDAPFTVEAVNPNTLALYQLAASATTPKPSAIKVGTFTFAADGSITFTASAVTPVIASSTLPAQTIAVGASSSTLSVTAKEASTYQWRLNGTPISGATNSSFTLINATLADAGSYSVVVSNATYGTTVTSSSAAITVIGAPSIVSGPDNVTVNNGVDATFTVTATNSYAGSGSNPALAYQWSHNGVALSGATNSSLTVSSAQVADAGTYAVVVSNLAGSATNSATLAVIDPYISVQPASVGVLSGSNATFTVTAVSGVSLGYQWRLNGTNLAGATGSSLTVTNCQATFSGRVYSVVVSNVNGTVTSSNATLTVGASVAIATPPASLVKFQGQVAIFTVKATGLAPLSYQWQLNGTPIVGATSSGYTNFSVNTNDAGSYTVVVSNAVGSATSAAATLTVNLDTNKPTAAITSPVAGATLFTAGTNLTGTATDPNGRVAQVLVSVNGGGYTAATLSITNTVPDKASWTYAMNFAVGTNTVSVKTVDFAGNQTTPVVTRSFFYAVPAPLTVNVVGSGAVAPASLVANLGGTNIFLNRSYSLQATPANTNWLFSNWVNQATSEQYYTNKYTFLMTSNLTLTVNFVTNRFIDAAGQYSGLFNEDSGAALDTAGFFTAKADAKQGISGSLIIRGEGNTFAAKLNVAGRTNLTMVRKARAPLSLDLQLGFDNTLTGTVSCVSEGWTANLISDRAVYSVANPATNAYAAKYNLLIPGAVGDTNSPSGYGYASFAIGVDGAVKVAGVMADGQAIKVPMKFGVSTDGYLPFYTPLYVSSYSNIVTYNGCAIGWLHLESDSTVTCTNLQWIKSGWTNGFYNAGFTNTSVIEGSAYTNVSPALTFTSSTAASAYLTDGNLAADILGLGVTITNKAGKDVFLFSTNGVPSLGLGGSFTAAAGTFSGEFINTGTGVATKYAGVYLPIQKKIAGQFLGTNYSGGVLITNLP